MRNLTIILLALILLSACAETNTKSAPKSTPEPVKIPTANELQKKADQLLIKDDTLREHFFISEGGIKLYEIALLDTSGGKEQIEEINLKLEDCQAFANMVRSLPTDSATQWYLHWNEWDHSIFEQDNTHPKFRASDDPEQPLKGLKIALDPGHIAGNLDFAVIEEKAVRMHPHPEMGLDSAIGFFEANLALATAHLLKQKLENAGAQVMMTREVPGQTAFGKTYQEWLKEDFESSLPAWAKERNLTDDQEQWFLNTATEAEKFHGMFKHLDLRERARRINEFQPDISVIIHYNVLETNEPDEEKFVIPVEENWNMAFVPGSFMKNELSTPDRRMEFLYQLVCQDIEEGVDLSDEVVKGLVARTGVPALNEPHGLRYLEKASLATNANGVWARNLAINHMVRGPICFGESFYQDNIEECQRLNQQNFEIAGIRTSSRVKDVANGYFEGICRYYGIAPSKL